MIQEQWLPLTDYSTKYKVSVSTLRRRIKAEDIRFKFEDGKYLISDNPIDSAQPREHRPSLKSDNLLSKKSVVEAGPVPVKKQEQAPAMKPTPTVSPFSAAATEISSEASSDEPILAAANQLLSELKKAYMVILQEKEEQILHLKEEVADLKTLVRVLESDNDRLRGETDFYK